jgi:hypothetical protein
MPIKTVNFSLIFQKSEFKTNFSTNKIKKFEGYDETQSLLSNFKM